MLLELQIENILLIEKLVINFRTGMTVITGQTGAGKSILLESIGIILGDKANNSLLRSGVASGFIIATFAIQNNNQIVEILNENGFHVDANESLLIIKKVFTKHGTRIFLNDIPATVNFISSISEHLIEMYSQFETGDIFYTKKHLSILDNFGNLAPKVEKVKQAFHSLYEVKKDIQMLTDEYDNQSKELEFMNEFLADIATLNLQVQEVERLKNRKIELQYSEKLSNNINNCKQMINSMKLNYYISKAQDCSQNIVKLLSDTPSELLSLTNEFNVALDQLSSSGEIVNEILSRMEDYVPSDNYELESIEERLAEVNNLARKYKIATDNISIEVEKISTQRELVAKIKSELQQLQDEFKLKEDAYHKVSTQLSVSRVEASKRLTQNVLERLKKLKMEKATFAVKFEHNASPTAHGVDNVTFVGSTNIGMPEMPIHKIASGGELARFMLAFKAAILQQKNVQTIIFDEIDTGVSGDVAHAIGLELLSMAKNTQVICVTHNSQTAACGENHILVTKEDNEISTITNAKHLNYEERVNAIAKMISGENITHEALQNAKRLLAK